MGGNFDVYDFEPGSDATNFLLGTLYSLAVGNNQLVNAGKELVLETSGTLTLPQGGTISEGVVTSNPTIQLTPASPDVASQKLVIKGGGTFSNTENGITVTVSSNTWTEGNVDYVYVDAPTRGGQTLYWWIYPEGAGLSTPSTGTVVLDEFGEGNFTFTLTSDAYEFRVRVSPEEDNYDSENVGSQSVLINSGSPTFDGDHHLHLTTGDLSVTSIILGTDNHNVRTTVDGGIQVTTESTADILPNTITITGADVAAVNLVYTRDLTETTPTWKSPQTGMPQTDPYIVYSVVDSEWGIVAPDYGLTPIYVNTGTVTTPLAQWSLNPPLGSVAPLGVYTYLTPDVHAWLFGTDGTTTFPTLTVPISDNATPSGTGQTLKFSDSSQQAIIFGPEALSLSNPSAQRVIIQGAPGYTGTAGEGGDVYVWAGPGGSTDGNGGDIKVRAGQGDGTGGGGYLNFQAGDSDTGNGGHINIESGESGTYGLGGDITVQARSGGEIYLRTRNSNGTNNDWLFGTDGKITLPQYNTSISQYDGETTFAGGTDDIGLQVTVDKTIYLRVGDNQWAFGAGAGGANILQLPAGGDIKNSAGTSVLGATLTLQAKPTTKEGQAGDLKGMVAIDSIGGELYYCIANYTDGTDPIWAKVAGSTGWI
jgi:hypothetical protein